MVVGTVVMMPVPMATTATGVADLAFPGVAGCPAWVVTADSRHQVDRCPAAVVADKAFARSAGSVIGLCGVGDEKHGRAGRDEYSCKVLCLHGARLDVKTQA